MSRTGYDEDDVRDARGGGWFGSRYAPDEELARAKREDAARNRRAAERERWSSAWLRDLDRELDGTAR